MSGLIAIVGRPNVGKSALFNRLVRRRIAIVHDQPGVTRDRISAEAQWRGHPFTLVDTGGIGFAAGEKASDDLTRAALDQVQIAVDAADAIIFVVDITQGILPLDREVAARLRRSAKPVFLAANKADTPPTEDGLVEFAELGFEKLFAVSAIHGYGIEPLLDAATACLPVGRVPATANPASDSVPSVEAIGAPIKLAIVGRPNVGKSSLVNALTRSKRVIVSPTPGTTRDAVDVPFEVETEGVRQAYVLIDTAGIRKTRRVSDSIEFFSVKRAEASIERCDIAVLVLDAEAGILEQDKKIADLITTARRGCIVVLNKWDLVEAARREAESDQAPRRVAPRPKRRQERPADSFANFGRWVQERLFFLDYAPVIFTSATSGFHLDQLLETVRYVAGQMQQRIPTALLNRTLHDAVERRQPVSVAGHRLKFFYATQVRQAPPTFLLFVNRDDLFSPPYQKYLADELRRAFGYEGCPLVLVPKTREKRHLGTDEARRPRRPNRRRRR